MKKEGALSHVAHTVLKKGAKNLIWTSQMIKKNSACRTTSIEIVVAPV